MRKIIYTNASGGVSIDTPVRCTGDEDMTDAEIEQRAWTRCLEHAIDPRWIDPAVLPVERMNAARKAGDAAEYHRILRGVVASEKQRKP